MRTRRRTWPWDEPEKKDIIAKNSDEYGAKCLPPNDIEKSILVQDYYPSNDVPFDISNCTSWQYPYQNFVKIAEKYSDICKYCFNLGSDQMEDVYEMLRRYHISYEVVDCNGNLPIVYEAQWSGDGSKGPFISLFGGGIKFNWKGTEFIVYQVSKTHQGIPTGASKNETFAFANSLAELRNLASDLNRFQPSPEGSILIYQGGWEYNHELLNDISGHTWDDLILPDQLKTEIKTNVERFFTDQGRVYTRLGIPYKRGFLFVGEPGSGKSLCGRIIAATMHVNFIYVLSLAGSNQTASEGIEEVFEKAREIAPCVILFEDLDTQINNDTRTVFLNALDGFKANDGVLTIGTTNHPQNIDIALTNRPSRFDRKFIFPNPTPDQVHIYLLDRVKKLMEVEELPLDIIVTINKLSSTVKKFSYAMLQELVVTAGHAWLLSDENEGLPKELEKAAAICQEQIKLGTGSRLQDAVDNQDNLGLRR